MYEILKQLIGYSNHIFKIINNSIEKKEFIDKILPIRMETVNPCECINVGICHKIEDLLNLETWPKEQDVAENFLKNLLAKIKLTNNIESIQFFLLKEMAPYPTNIISNDRLVCRFAIGRLFYEKYYKISVEALLKTTCG
jgi:hypothetical protein